MERHDDDALIIYTDGSCLPKPRRGGYAFRLIWIDADGEEQVDDTVGPGVVGATNNEMELTACVEALKVVSGRHSPVPPKAYRKVVLYTDSMYVLENHRNAWSAWPHNDWLTRDGEPVLSPDLWKEFVRQYQRAGRVEVRKVKAHKSNPHNKAVDKLAKLSAETARAAPSSPRVVRRRTSPRKTEPRVVRMAGQEETIRIVMFRQIRGQPHHMYKYEVVDPASPDFEAVDDAFALDAAVDLRPHHTYRVRFGSGPGRWIDEVLAEVVSEVAK